MFTLIMLYKALSEVNSIQMESPTKINSWWTLYTSAYLGFQWQAHGSWEARRTSADQTETGIVCWRANRRDTHLRISEVSAPVNIGDYS